jgi:hypothetical protein
VERVSERPEFDPKSPREDYTGVIPSDGHVQMMQTNQKKRWNKKVLHRNRPVARTGR